MSDNKLNISLISINSPHELTGGGHYLRSLVRGYCNNSQTVHVIAKNIGASAASELCDLKYKETLLAKTFLADAVSRLFLSINFMFYYFIKILRSVSDSDVVAFHSSRLGILAMLVKLIFPKKLLICHFDNVERELLSARVRKFELSFKYFLALYDFLLVGFTEKLALHFCDKVSFITSVDAEYFSQEKSFILPICFPKHSKVMNELPQTGLPHHFIAEGFILFTASFDFEPNVRALKDVKKISEMIPNNFLVAGRCAENFSFYRSKNFEIISSPNSLEMESLFRSASSYICPVNTGSGMKTKVAEAMKYGLHVFATKHSLIGYENVRGAPYIHMYNDYSDVCNLILNSKFENDKAEIIADFELHYSMDKINLVIQRMIT